MDSEPPNIIFQGLGDPDCCCLVHIVQRDNDFVHGVPFMLITKTVKSSRYIYTTKAWKKGEQILKFEGKIVLSCVASVHHSLSINEFWSFEWPLEHIQSHFNHSCDSNCFIVFENDIPILTARKDIDCDKELCYNYNAVDYNRLSDMTAFCCNCDSNKCVGNIRGYCYLTAKQKEEIADIISPFISSLLS